MGNCLGEFCVEHEAAGGVSVPANHHSLLGKRVEGGVYLGRGEDLAVEAELALAGGGVEDSDPLRVGPS